MFRHRQIITDNVNEILTIDELAGYLKVPKSTLYKLVQAGRVPGKKVGRHWRFARETIDTWMASGPTLQPEADPQGPGEDAGNEAREK